MNVCVLCVVGMGVWVLAGRVKKNSCMPVLSLSLSLSSSPSLSVLLLLLLLLCNRTHISSRSLSVSFPVSRNATSLSK
ncbi:hypothetical protein F5B17DRAFT_269115 [Nemania serpens]|nr:hypothetical protein F5B17DRAFT_269115 [Nemania serpens]